MTIANTKVVDNTSKYIVQSKGIGSETDQVLVDAEKLTDGNNKSLAFLVAIVHKYTKIIEEVGSLNQEDGTSNLNLEIQLENYSKNYLIELKELMDEHKQTRDNMYERITENYINGIYKGYL